MEKQESSDVAAFPALFDDMEQFIAEQAASLRRTSVTLAILATASGALLFYALNGMA